MFPKIFENFDLQIPEKDGEMNQLEKQWIDAEGKPRHPQFGEGPALFKLMKGRLP
jgi:hypothetical protein